MEKKAYIYLGPNIPNGLLWSGSIYKDNYPEHLNDLFEKVPEVKKLFVEIQNAVEFKRKLSQKGTEEERLYSVVENKVRRG